MLHCPISGIASSVSYLENIPDPFAMKSDALTDWGAKHIILGKKMRGKFLVTE